MIGYPEQTRLAEYVRHRLEQLEEERRIVEAFKAKHTLDPRREIYDLNNVLRELETSNDGETKERNVRYLIPQLFYLDLGAILNGEELLPLPDSLLEIQPHLEKLERQRMETEKRLRVEQEVQESRRLHEQWRLMEAERQKSKRARLADELGIDVGVLERLREGGIRNGAIWP